jgi:hypothetical protein
VTPIPDSVEALRRLLRDDDDVRALTGERVYGDEIPEDAAAAMPLRSIVVRPVSGPHVFGGGWQKFGDVRFDVLCYGRSRRESFDLYRYVQPLLKGLRTTRSADCLIYWARQGGGPLTLTDPDSEWPYTFSSWQVLVAERN